VTFLARTTPSDGPTSRLRVAAAAALTPSHLSLGRAGVGTVMLARPTALGSLLGVDRDAAAATGFAVQMLGVREVALGVGAWTSLRRGDVRSSRLWLLAGLVSDAVDAVVVAGAVGRGRVHTAAGAAVVATATTAAAVQAAALAEG
jgi:hypothetical protein